ncbi:hypothetical protein ACJMK2_031776, partial [Sinanodonta woodiana]
LFNKLKRPTSSRCQETGEISKLERSTRWRGQQAVEVIKLERITSWNNKKRMSSELNHQNLKQHVH